MASPHEVAAAARNRPETQTTHKTIVKLTDQPRRYQAAKENPTGARAPLKVVYVVLESQYQSSMSAAVKAINDNENSGVACECVGYLLEELRDPANAAAFKKDVEEANVFIGAISASRGAAVPSRHRRASSPGDEVAGGFFFIFEPFSTCSEILGDPEGASVDSGRRAVVARS